MLRQRQQRLILLRFTVNGIGQMNKNGATAATQSYPLQFPEGIHTYGVVAKAQAPSTAGFANCIGLRTIQSSS